MDINSITISKMGRIHGMAMGNLEEGSVKAVAELWECHCPGLSPAADRIGKSTVDCPAADDLSIQTDPVNGHSGTG